jgi:hypothetical protein
MNFGFWSEDCCRRANRAARLVLQLAAAALLLSTLSLGKGLAEDSSSRDAVRKSVAGDDIQRVAPLPEQVRQELGKVEQQPEIQKDRPKTAPTPDRRTFTQFNLPWLPYVIIGAVGIGLLFLLARFLSQRAGSQSKDAVAKPALAAQAGTALEPAPTEIDRTFDEIDALAKAGAFTEAVHRLLLLVQSRLRRRLESGMQPSLTSREILRRAKLPGEAATAFGTLVAAVEISHFGMQSANAATYALCREQCRQVLAVTAE